MGRVLTAALNKVIAMTEVFNKGSILVGGAPLGFETGEGKERWRVCLFDKPQLPPPRLPFYD